ncbi:MAG TPA: 2-amino-4-hydroxy-6-hydroxymethyldihydropteridine diphosphokinase [Steroidobacteraceae bacterium]|jgi:2-amino-4-hydroxy-6-hydroxymethyldihydropteridine diphosphokinase|nr:2-amino-4-hydroxy-6-hydroxymethyldihydropteridine diphosphokinase [Steroidobacteraceae bacterium]
MLWQSAYVGVGSNLDGPELQVRCALAALERLTDTLVVLRSALYGSKPFGPVQQPDFVNAVAALLTQLSPPQLLQGLRALETQLGRAAPRERWGPRRIDLDLLVFGRERSHSEELTLPHPQIAARNFVLYPLCELAPELPIPGAVRVRELAARVDPDGIWRLDGQPIRHER